MHQDSDLPKLPRLPQEIWHKVTSHVHSFTASHAASVFDFELDRYDQIWNAVFKSEAWVESPGGRSANIVLIGADLDVLSTKKDGRLVLTAYDHGGDLQYESQLLLSSLKGALGESETYERPEESECPGEPREYKRQREYESPREYMLEVLTLSVGNLDCSEILGTDFSYLFSKNETKLQTKYCYWNDPEKKIRLLEAPKILGIGGPIFEVEDLKPIFLLNLDPPEQCIPDYCRSGPRKVPEQFIFRNFGGVGFWSGTPPLVESMQGDKMENGEYVFNGFLFNNEAHQNARREIKDWIEVAEADSASKCDLITFQEIPIRWVD